MLTCAKMDKIVVYLDNMVRLMDEASGFEIKYVREGRKWYIEKSSRIEFHIDMKQFLGSKWVREHFEKEIGAEIKDLDKFFDPRLVSLGKGVVKNGLRSWLDTAVREFALDEYEWDGNVWAVESGELTTFTVEIEFRKINFPVMNALFVEGTHQKTEN